MASFVKARPALVKWEDADEEPEMMTAEVDPSSLTGMMMTTGREGSELPIDMSEWTQEELQAYNNLRSKRKKCCVGGCTHRSIPIARSYHQLPVRNKEIWAKWIEIIRWSRNDPEWAPNGDAAPLVCSRHFPDSDFISYEASSRVRLSHTAIPMFYVDLPEGTVMDSRFSTPLPIPPIVAAGNVKKESQKANKSKMVADDEYGEAQGIFSATHLNYDANTSQQFANNNYGYDIEEVNDDSYDGMYDVEDLVPENFQAHYSNDQVKYNNYGGAGNSSGIRQIRLSAPPTLVNSQKPKQVSNPARSKPPALIRANFTTMQASGSQSKIIPLGGNLKAIVRKENNQSASSIVCNTQPKKHKIGIAKCRLIVKTLENQLKIAKMRLAEQLDIPFQIVQGVWNMKDSLKDKL